jgi:hypothetical protein
MSATSYSVLEDGPAYRAIRHGSAPAGENVPALEEALAWCHAQAGARGEAARIRVQRRCKEGDRLTLELPWSEVCHHMRVAGKFMQAVLKDYSVQLYNPDGSPFSGPITHGEAGIYDDRERGYYYYQVIEVPAPVAASVS